MSNRSDQPAKHSTPGHDPKSCSLCAIGRHPSQRANRIALAKHLKTNPLPTQGARS